MGQVAPFALGTGFGAMDLGRLMAVGPSCDRGVVAVQSRSAMTVAVWPVTAMMAAAVSATVKKPHGGHGDEPEQADRQKNVEDH